MQKKHLHMALHNCVHRLCVRFCMRVCCAGWGPLLMQGWWWGIGCGLVGSACLVTAVFVYLWVVLFRLKHVGLPPLFFPGRVQWLLKARLEHSAICRVGRGATRACSLAEQPAAVPWRLRLGAPAPRGDTLGVCAVDLPPQPSRLGNGQHPLSRPPAAPQEKVILDSPNLLGGF